MALNTDLFTAEIFPVLDNQRTKVFMNLCIDLSLKFKFSFQWINNRQESHYFECSAQNHRCLNCKAIKETYPRASLSLKLVYITVVRAGQFRFCLWFVFRELILNMTSMYNFRDSNSLTTVAKRTSLFCISLLISSNRVRISCRNVSMTRQVSSLFNIHGLAMLGGLQSRYCSLFHVIS